MKILTLNKSDGSFWYQYETNHFGVGHLSEANQDVLLNDARSNGAVIFDVSDLGEDVLVRLRKKFWNRRGCVDDVELYVEALRLNNAKEIK